MSTLKEIQNRIRSFFHKDQRDTDLAAELASHLEFAVEENMQQGMSPDEARRRALVRFGGVAQASEKQRDARGLPQLDILLQELRYALRNLGRDRAFTLVAVMILALGIGANIAVFSVVNTILLRPLPFHQPQSLVRIVSAEGVGGESSNTYTTNAVQEFQQRNRSFEKVSGYFAFTSADNYKLMGNGVPVPLTGILVADNFFETLEVKPSLGRLFAKEEYFSHGRSAVLLSHAFWKRQLNSNPNIIGQSLNLNNTPVTVVGVLPETFDFGSVFSPGAKVDVFTPFVMEDFKDDGNVLALVGRLNPGVTLAQAQAEANLLFPKLDASLKHPEWKADYHAKLLGLKDYVSGKLRKSLIVLWSAVGLILLIVCVNLSNLLLARSASRTKEFAMRFALGAGRGRLLRQLLTESLVLALTGAALGLGIAFAIVTYLAHQKTITLPLLNNVQIDGASMAWTLIIAIAAAVLFGIVPGMRTSGGNLQEALKDSGHGNIGGRKQDRLRSMLVYSEVALACVLLVGSGLLLRSFLRVLDVDLGFQPAHAAAISVDYDDGNNTAKRSAILQNILTRVKGIPGVESAGFTDNLPLSRNRGWDIRAKGVSYAPGVLQPTFVYVVSPGYLGSIGMRLVKGRDIAWDDDSKDQAVVIINETVAKALWPGQDPIGRIAEVGGADARVIGVIADVRESSVESSAGWQMYVSAVAPQYGPDGMQLVVRTGLATSVLAPGIISTLREINHDQPANEFRPVQLLVDHAVSPRRFFVLLVVSFGVFGAILAALGIYGVISYSVTQQTKEIGIRMALGASVARVQMGVLLKTLQLTIIGLTAGMVASFLVARAIAALLYGTAPNDPATFGAVVLLLGTVALFAGYLPARRASRIDPLVALRN
jgi:predicted permease